LPAQTAAVKFSRDSEYYLRLVGDIGGRPAGSVAGDQLLDRDSLEMKTRPTQALSETGHPVVTVGALIFNQRGLVLVVRTHKWSNLWGIPGGKVKFGETSVAALRRELKEETNLDVSEIEFVLVQDCIHSPEFYRDAHFVLLNYSCRCLGHAEVRLNDEAIDFRWVETKEALGMELNQPTRILLQAVGDRAGRNSKKTL
jgi:ADP-ribose pyrophosphatase YjhB (NUDIX family)